MALDLRWTTVSVMMQTALFCWIELELVLICDAFHAMWCAWEQHLLHFKNMIRFLILGLRSLLRILSCCWWGPVHWLEVVSCRPWCKALVFWLSKNSLHSWSVLLFHWGKKHMNVVRGAFGKIFIWCERCDELMSSQVTGWCRIWCPSRIWWVLRRRWSWLRLAWCFQCHLNSSWRNL